MLTFYQSLITVIATSIFRLFTCKSFKIMACAIWACFLNYVFKWMLLTVLSDDTNAQLSFSSSCCSWGVGKGWKMLWCCRENSVTIFLVVETFGHLIPIALEVTYSIADPTMVRSCGSTQVTCKIAILSVSLWLDNIRKILARVVETLTFQEKGEQMFCPICVFCPYAYTHAGCPYAYGMMCWDKLDLTAPNLQPSNLCPNTHRGLPSGQDAFSLIFSSTYIHRNSHYLYMLQVEPN